jgi:two-component system, OmpR family, phosphate regulon response regulator PhoB
MPLVYALTAAGQEALSASDVGETDFPLQVDFPSDYRRLLAMIEVGGHIEVIRGRLRRFPDQLIDDWLKELEELELIESHEAGDLDEITFTGAPLPLLPPLSDDDRKRLAKTTVVAGATLLRSGSFLSAERIVNLAPLAKRRTETVVLLVEDDPDQAALAELRLTMAGYHVHSVDRAKALSSYLRQQKRPDVLLLDVMLPDGNGFDILAQLRGRPEFSTLPIVLLTARAELVDIRNGLALGADGYITKPYSKSQLAEVIGHVLKH